MSKTGLLAALLAASFASTGFAQTAAAPDKGAMQAKKTACQAEAKPKKFKDKTERKAFMDACLKR